MMGANPAPLRPLVGGVSDGDCLLCRKKKMTPATSRIKTTTHNQNRRFWPDAGCKGTLGGALERTGCGGVSGIFTSMLFYFRRS
jgi:hypothetical protein